MIKAIKNKREYEKALKRVYELMQMQLKTNSAEFNELEVLSILLELYERHNFPISHANPIEAIKFRMEQQGIGKAELAEILGSRSRATEVLNGKRGLSLAMIKALHKNLKIPLSTLIGE